MIANASLDIDYLFRNLVYLSLVDWVMKSSQRAVNKSIPGVFMKVLISFVGMTDPMRDGFDGPLLHIVRHNHIDAVVLIHSKETESFERMDARFTRSLQALTNSKIEIDQIFTQSTNVHRFDEFDGILPAIIDDAMEKFSPDRLVFNVSSGTAAMTAALSIEAVTRGDLVQSIQVSTPIKESNYNMPHIGKDPIDVLEYLKNNFDNDLDCVTENRCSVVGFNNLRHNNIKQKLVSLIENYEYRGALNLVKEHIAIINREVADMLKHCVERESLNYSAAVKLLSAEKHPELYPIADKKSLEISEYLMVMCIRQRCGQIPDLVTKVTPFLFELASYYVKDILKIDLKSYGISASGRVDFESISSTDSEKHQYFRQEYGGVPRPGHLAFEKLIKIIKYEQKQTTIVANDVLQRLDNLREFEAKIRNEVAHTIMPIDEIRLKTIADDIRKKFPTYNLTSSKKLYESLVGVMKSFLGNRVSKYDFVYDTLNTKIKLLLVKR